MPAKDQGYGHRGESLTTYSDKWPAFPTLDGPAPEIKEGRELDIYIEQCITGQDYFLCRIDPTKHGRYGEPQFYYGYPVGHDYAPNYSTDESVALTIIKRLNTETVWVILDGSAGKWCIIIDYSKIKVASEYQESIPLALCDVLVQIGPKLKEILNDNRNND